MLSAQDDHLDDHMDDRLDDHLNHACKDFIGLCAQNRFSQFLQNVEKVVLLWRCRQPKLA